MSPMVILICAVIVAASGLLSPAFALLLGLVLALVTEHPFRTEAHKLTKFLLQAAVVLLGFGMNLGAVARAGRMGFGYTAISIVFALSLGLLLGKLMRVKPRASLLIAAGTAICGGSAIAAIGPVCEAGEDEMAVALGTVFSLNAVALLLFPFVGHLVGLSQAQFGLWSALAIHDTSSVVGATAKYGPQALEIGTTVKLVRSLWIVPLALVVAFWTSRNGRLATASGEHTAKTNAKIAWPWFIALFLAAAAVRSFYPEATGVWTKLSGLGRNAMEVVLLLIGASLSPAMLKRVGWKPMLQGVLLWIVVATLSLVAIHLHWINA
ncbi:conserved hypothetical integral membrane protein [Bryocella elongata]|uniref:Conserved hypothetical integral membrane protein n=1 Tax=Bryocella elongata TaxID=863522 RepID=A0A1H6A5P6_9BACT|nr:putative sulfate exporter family transporter [Bryocella elongata]SEG43692.1 conserved hypothetical integral membrane protein [Bryocella elongata]